MNSDQQIAQSGRRSWERAALWIIGVYALQVSAVALVGRWIPIVSGEFEGAEVEVYRGTGTLFDWVPVLGGMAVISGDVWLVHRNGGASSPAIQRRYDILELVYSDYPWLER